MSYLHYLIGSFFLFVLPWCYLSWWVALQTPHWALGTLVFVALIAVGWIADRAMQRRLVDD